MFLGIDYGDNPDRGFFARVNCEDIVLKLIEELGWLEDFDASIIEKLPTESRDLFLQELDENKSATSKN